MFFIVYGDLDIIVVYMVRRVVDNLAILECLKQFCAGVIQSLGGGKVILI